MSQKNIKWLYGELPKWVNEGIITAEQEEKVHLHYGKIDEKNWLQITLAVFGTLGAVLIGTGIILLLAKNWTELSRGVRTILSLLPLLAGQMLAGWVLYNDKRSMAWREGTSTFLFLAVGSSIALIGQTYHIPGDMGSFLLSWMLLGLPLVYLFDASVPVIFYLIGITAWAGYVQSEGGQVLLFWVLAALLIPHVWRRLSESIFSSRSIFICWTIALTFCVAIGVTLEKVLPGLWIIIYTSYFVILYLIGKIWLDQAETFWERPFQSVGLAGSFILSFMLTYQWPWRDIGWDHYRTGTSYHQWAGIQDYLLVTLLFAYTLYLIFLYKKKRNGRLLIYTMPPVLSFIGYAAASLIFDHDIVLILYNIFLLAAGINTIITGIRERKMGLTNVGMIIITILIVLRFFDADWSFAVRGLAFIMIGIGFLISNYLVWNRRKGDITQ